VELGVALWLPVSSVVVDDLNSENSVLEQRGRLLRRYAPRNDAARDVIARRPIGRRGNLA
jgi:hypothetical protein